MYAHFNRFVMVIILLYGGIILPGQCTFAESYQAGLAKTVITPEKRLWMSGYASRSAPAESTYQDLFAKALVLKAPNGTESVFISTDLIGVTASMTAAIRNEVNESTGIPKDHVLVTASHTHCGPMLDGNLQVMFELNEEETAAIDNYNEDLINKIVDTVIKASQQMQAANLSRGQGHAAFGKNRRIYTPDGMRFGINPIGPVDHDVPTLCVRNSDDEVIGLLFGYACHNTTLSFNHYCGDYAGYAQEYLEEMYPEATALFFSGCAGDINPQPRRELSDAKAHGHTLAGAVHDVVNQPMTPVNDGLVIASSTIDLKLSPAPGREELLEQTNSDNVYIKRRAENLLKQLEREGTLPETHPYPIQVWRMDEFVMIALGGEVVVDYALRLKHELGPDNTWVVAYANDVMGYIPSLRVLQEGGYEAETSMIYYGLHGPWGPSVEEDIISEVHTLVEETASQTN